MKWEGNVITWKVIVGSMGMPANPGEPPQNVQALPYIHIPHTSTKAGSIIDETYSFKVLADLQWLADRADIAGQQIEAAYLGGVKILEGAFGPYKKAYDDHKHSLENVLQKEAAHRELVGGILVGIFITAVAGGAGGVVSQLIKKDSKELETLAWATAGSDVTKFSIRLSTTSTGGGGSSGKGHDKGTPSSDPTKGTGSQTGGVGFDPELWIADRKSVYAAEGKKASQACIDLKLNLSEAWARGRTDLMDQDPVDIIAPYVEELQTPLPILAQ